MSLVKEKALELAEKLQDALMQANELANSALVEVGAPAATVPDVSPFIFGLTVFLLAVFVGYYVVWKVTPALHSPLMSVTNAISSVIIVGALIAAGQDLSGAAKIGGFIAIVLASINIFGGFVVTSRMLEMFDGKKGAKK
jgi:H+-translocating NAD(P) transhydrogenase subunit alpha